jgi:hypothetical protein
MIILGINAYHGDVSAVLLRDEQRRQREDPRADAVP